MLQGVVLRRQRGKGVCESKGLPTTDFPGQTSHFTALCRCLQSPDHPAPHCRSLTTLPGGSREHRVTHSSLGTPKEDKWTRILWVASLCWLTPCCRTCHLAGEMKKGGRQREARVWARQRSVLSHSAFGLRHSPASLRDAAFSDKGPAPAP